MDISGIVEKRALNICLSANYRSMQFMSKLTSMINILMQIAITAIQSVEL